MNIRNKLYLSAGISILFVVIIVASIIITSSQINEKNEKSRLAMDLQLAVGELDILANEYFLHHGKRMEEQWNRRYSDVAKVLREEEEEEEEEEENKRLVETLRADYIDLGRLFLQITRNYNKEQSFIKANVSQEKIDLLTGLEERLVSQFLTTSKEIVSNSAKLGAISNKRADVFQRFSNVLVLVLIIFLAVVITTTSLLVTRSITNPINKLILANKKFSEGVYSTRVKISSGDEFEQLGNSVNEKFKAVQQRERKLAKSKKELEQSYTKLQKETHERQKLALAVEKITDVLYIADPISLQAVYVNPAVQKLFGYSQKEWLKDPLLWEKAIYPADREKVLAHFAELKKQKKEGMITYRILDKNAGIIWVSDSSSWLIDSKGEPVALVGVLHNVTLERTIAAEQKQIIELRKNILMHTSHEIKTPITPVLIQAEMLRDEELGELSEEQKKSLTVIIQNMERLTTLIDNILLMSKLDVENTELKLETVAVQEIVQAVVNRYQAQAKKKGISLISQISAALKLPCESEKILQVFSNLIDNAIKFTEQGSIMLEGKIEKGFVKFSVTDTGKGIVKKDIQKLFTLFTQVTPSYSLRKQGTGIGLTICKKIVERHGGKIWMESAGLGKGTTVYFILPVRSKKMKVNMHPPETTQGSKEERAFYKEKDNKK
jgi:PAS domain S-box-containing protein